MSQPRPDIHQWQTWRIVTADDPAFSLFDPAAFTAAVLAKSVNANPRFNAVAIRAFGKDTANDTAAYAIYGFMDPDTNQKRTGAGSPCKLISGIMALSVANDSFIPLANDPANWGTAAATWFAVDDWGIISNLAGGVLKLVANDEGFLLLPTWGFNNLFLRITSIGGGGTEMTELGVMYRSLYIPGMSHIALV